MIVYPPYKTHKALDLVMFLLLAYELYQNVDKKTNCHKKYIEVEKQFLY